MVKVRNVLLFYLSVFTVVAFAQEPKQTIRLELPFTKQETSVEVHAIPDSSLLVYYKISNAWNTKADFYFTKYNHQLQETWSTSVDIPPSYEYIRHFTEMPFTYMVFSGTVTDEYIFTKTNTLTGHTDVNKYKLQDIDEIYEFNVLKGNYFLIGRNRTNSKLLLLHLKPSEDKPTQLPSVYGEESTFSDMLADRANERLDVVLSESNGRISRLQVKSFDADGKLINNYFILQKNDKSLLNAEITPGDSTQKMLIGTYATRDLRFTSGFFSTPVVASFSEGNFYSILQLKNFLKFMKPRREERIRSREAERVKAGKEPLSKYRILLHDLITTPTGYILAGEAYYPQYKSNTYQWTFDRRQSIYKPTEGYKRTHAVAMEFDKNGYLLWDNIFPLKDVSSVDLTHTIEVSHTKDGRVIIAYPKDDEIMYSVLKDDTFDKEEYSLKIKTYNEDDKVQLTEEANLIKWYDSNFVAFGFQRIKQSGIEPRSVLYLNKISF